MSAVEGFVVQFEALLRGITEGETELLKDQIQEGTENFLQDVFFYILRIIQKNKAETQAIEYPKVFNYTGRTANLTRRWILQKNSKLGRKGSLDPHLWKGTSHLRGRKRLVDLLDELSDEGKGTGKKLFKELGGLSAEGSISGSSALRPGIVISGFNGRPYNPTTKKYVSWEQAVTPRVNHYLKQAAVMPVSGSGVRKTSLPGRVSVKGVSGTISLQRAVANGLLRAGISVSYLSVLNNFVGQAGSYDDLAQYLAQAGLISDADQKKFNHLHQYNHGILTPWFGFFLTSDGEGSLSSYLKDAGVNLG